MLISPRTRARRGLVALLVLVLAGLTPVVSSGPLAPAGAAEPAPRGYWMVASDGGIFAYGDARFFGSTGNIKLNMPIVGMAPTPSGQGYWLVASDGGIFAFGDAGFYGSTGSMKLNKPIVGMTATRTGRGYWLVASDGGIFAFGDARFFGSTGSLKLNKPITGMTPSVTGQGYRMVATDGGIFSFGDAAFHGSAAGTKLAWPVSGMAPTPSGQGYWLVAADGTILPYGDATSFGSATALRSVAAMAPTPTGAGYWAVAADGSLAAFGDAADIGHPTMLAQPIVGMAALPSSAAGTPAQPGGTIDPDTPGPAGPGGTNPPSPGVKPATLDKLYAVRPLDGTIGTRPQVMLDPSHPFRKVCDSKPCTESNANYAEEIRTFALVGDRLFVGGFIHGLLDPSTGGKGTKIFDEVQYLVELDARTGQVASDLTFTRNASPDATVEGMEVSPDGKVLYISGRFTRVGGGDSPMFAALELTGPRAGLLVEGWNPSRPKGGSVHDVALSEDGTRLFIGGAFEEIDGNKRWTKVAAVDARTGRLIKDWLPPPIGGSYVDRQGTPTEGEAGMVNAVAVIGRYVVVGGEFLHTGPDAFNWPAGKYDPHGGLVVLNVSDGQIADWKPRNDRPVNQITLSPDRSFLCAAVGGQGGGATCLRPGEEWPMMNTAQKPPWDGMSEHAKLDHHIAHVDGDALAIAISDTRIYLGGHYDVAVPDPDDPCLHNAPSICIPPLSGPDEKDVKDDTARPHKHLVAFRYDGSIDETWTTQANTPEGPTTLLAGPHALYLGGNFTRILEEHPGADCWPCATKDYKGKELIFRPGFAMFPAIP